MRTRLLSLIFNSGHKFCEFTQSVSCRLWYRTEASLEFITMILDLIPKAANTRILTIIA